MAALFRIGMLFIAVFGMGFLFVNEVLNLGGKNNRLQKHLNRLRESLAQFKEDLVPMDREELGLLSMDRLKKKVKNSSLKILAGQFLSIYNEPSLSYAWLRYNSRKSLLMAKSQENEYHYLLTGSRIEIYLNGSRLGVLTTDGQLLGGPENKELLANLALGAKLKYQEIKNAEGKLLASLYNPWMEDRNNQRVFHFIEDQKSEDLQIVKALAFLNLIQRSNIG